MLISLLFEAAELYSAIGKYGLGAAILGQLVLLSTVVRLTSGRQDGRKTAFAIHDCGIFAGRGHRSAKAVPSVPNARWSARILASHLLCSLAAQHHPASLTSTQLLRFNSGCLVDLGQK